MGWLDKPGAQGALSAAGSVAGSIAQGIYGMAMQRRQHDYNLSEMDYQARLAREQWQRQNEYDSPAAQMQRLKDAGLNPDLMYGGLQNGNNVQSVAQSHGVGMPQIDPQNAGLMSVQAYNSARMADAEIHLKQSQANMYDKNALYTQALTQSQGILDALHMQQTDESRQKVAESIVRIDEIKANISLTDARTVEQNIRNGRLDEQIDAEIAQRWAAVAADEAYVREVNEWISEAAASFPYELAQTKNSAAASSGLAYQALLQGALAKRFIKRGEDGKYQLTGLGEKYFGAQDVLDVLGQGLGIIGDLVDMGVTLRSGKRSGHKRRTGGRSRGD